MPSDEAGSPRPPPGDLALLLMVATIWGLNFIPIRWALDEVPPFALVGLRFLLAGLPLAFFVRPPTLPIRHVVAYGLAVGVFQFGFLFLAIRLGLAAGLASLLMQMQIFFTMALAAAFTKDRITRRQVMGAVLALVGLGVLAWSLLREGARANLVSLALVLLASLAWAVGNIVAKAASQRTRFDMFALVVWSSLVAPLPLALVSFGLEGGWAPLHAIMDASLRTWGSLLFMAYAATLAGYGTWNRLLRRHSAGLLAPFTMLVPVVGLAGGAIVLGESLRPAQFLGALLILAGIGITLVRFSVRRRAPAEVGDGPITAA